MLLLLLCLCLCFCFFSFFFSFLILVYVRNKKFFECNDKKFLHLTLRRRHHRNSMRFCCEGTFYNCRVTTLYTSLHANIEWWWQRNSTKLNVLIDPYPTGFRRCDLQRKALRGSYEVIPSGCKSLFFISLKLEKNKVL